MADWMSIGLASLTTLLSAIAAIVAMQARRKGTTTTNATTDRRELTLDDGQFMSAYGLMISSAVFGAISIVSLVIQKRRLFNNLATRYNNPNAAGGGAGVRGPGIQPLV